VNVVPYWRDLPSKISYFGDAFDDLVCMSNCLASALETSGWVTGIKQNSTSSSGGINSLPRLSNNGMLMIKATILMMSVVLRQVTHQFNIGR